MGNPVPYNGGNVATAEYGNVNRRLYERGLAADTPNPQGAVAEYGLAEDGSRNEGGVKHVGLAAAITGESGVEYGADFEAARAGDPGARLSTMPIAFTERPFDKWSNGFLSGLHQQIRHFHGDGGADDYGAIYSRQDAGMESDNLQRNTHREELEDWDRNYVWGIEQIHPELVGINGIIQP